MSAEDRRVFPLGFALTMLAPGTTVDISARPQIAFKGNRLVVTKGANHARIEQLRAGVVDQLV